MWGVEGRRRAGWGGREWVSAWFGGWVGSWVGGLVGRSVGRWVSRPIAQVCSRDVGEINGTK